MTIQLKSPSRFSWFLRHVSAGMHNVCRGTAPRHGLTACLVVKDPTRPARRAKHTQGTPPSVTVLTRNCSLKLHFCRVREETRRGTRTARCRSLAQAQRTGTDATGSRAERCAAWPPRPPLLNGYAIFACCAALSASLSSRRRILPTLLFGSSSRNSMYFGFL